MWAIDLPNIEINARFFRCKVCVFNRKANYFTASFWAYFPFVFVQPPFFNKIKNGRSFYV